MSAREKTVLIVDDSPLMRFQLEGILEDDGYEVVDQAENGEEAVEKYKKYEPELVTMDIVMPDVDGLEALKEIKEYNEDVTVVMISTVRNKEKVMDAIKLGAEDYVVKPFEPDQVIEKIGKSID